MFTVGGTRDRAKHALKWTTDIGVGFDEIDGEWASAGLGWREDTATEDGQVVVRSQFQLLF